jgi:DNA replication protein DnaC
MATKLEQLLAQSPYLNQKPKDSLEHYSHIELTEEEVDEAILAAKVKKSIRLEYEENQRRAEENRRALTSTAWSAEQTKSFMLYRAKQVFEKPFALDEHNQIIFDLLCHYFSGDDSFVAIAENLGVANPSLDKGIFLAGNFGVGKTWLMKLFARNKRQVYHLHNAKGVADAFETDGEEAVRSFVQPIKNAVNDGTRFYQPYSGLCLDDIGTEDVKTNYGNKKNVIGDLIEKRYAAGSCGVLLHATTNLSAEELKTFYGGRVTSRMREIFNFIELPGQDRRK